MDYLKNFGIADEETVVAAGINGKMNEFTAALGLLQLKYISRNIDHRKKVSNIYDDELKDIEGIVTHTQRENVESNYSYYPILVADDYFETRDDLYERLRINRI